MGRTYLIFIVIAGLFAALVSDCSSRKLDAQRRPDLQRAGRPGRTSLRPREPRPLGNDQPVRGGGRAAAQLGRPFLCRHPDQRRDRPCPGRYRRDPDRASRADAGSAGIATSIGMPEVVGEGADGAVHGEIVRLDRVTLGHKTAEGMTAVVLNSGGAVAARAKLPQQVRLGRDPRRHDGAEVSGRGPFALT